VTKKIIIAAVFAVLLGIIIFQNTQIVTYRFYFWTVSVSQLILAPLVAAAGFVLGFLTANLKRKHKSNGQ
jgi:uncharacterized integral membrane protein